MTGEACPGCGQPVELASHGTPCRECGGGQWVHVVRDPTMRGRDPSLEAGAWTCRVKRCRQGHLMRLEVRT
jgi:hypothetical protein